MKTYGTAATGTSGGAGVPVPTTPIPHGQRDWTINRIPLTNPTPIYTPPPPKRVTPPRPKTGKAAYSGQRLTEKQREEIQRRYLAGELRHRIAVSMKLPRSTVDRWAAKAEAQRGKAA
jgi:hypothetical protein